MAILLDPLKADWGLSVSMDTVWETDVSVSRETGTEERRTLIRAPRRILNFRVTPCTPQEVLDLVIFLKRSSEEQLIVPLVQDHTESTQTSSGNTVNVDDPLSLRRFNSGKLFVICSRDGSIFESGTVDSFGGNTTFTTVDPLANVYGPGHLVFPAIEAEINLEQQRAGVLTDGIVRQQLTLREVVSDDALPPWIDEQSIRDGSYAQDYELFDGQPILPTEPDYATSFRFEMPRIGDQFKSGFGFITNVRAPIPRFSWTERLRFCNRLDWYYIFRFYSSRRGRALPFWNTLPIALWQAVAFAPGQVDVVAGSNLGDTGWITHLGIVGPDGTKFITAIDSRADLGSIWRFTISDPLPAGWAPENVRFTTAAVLCRFARDSFREIWDTSELPRASLEITSLINEMDFATTIPGTFLSGGTAVISNIYEQGGLKGGGSGILSSIYSLGGMGGGGSGLISDMVP